MVFILFLQIEFKNTNVCGRFIHRTFFFITANNILIIVTLSYHTSYRQGASTTCLCFKLIKIHQLFVKFWMLFKCFYKIKNVQFVWEKKVNHRSSYAMDICYYGYMLLFCKFCAQMRRLSSHNDNIFKYNETLKRSKWILFNVFVYYCCFLLSIIYYLWSIYLNASDHYFFVFRWFENRFSLK